MTCCIYRLISPSGKSYIGQSVDFDRRLIEHKSVMNKKKSLPKLYQAFKKYGFENFSIEILESCEPELLNEKETYWINHYDSCNNGYNCTTGGDSKFFRSKETKEKLRKHFTGVYNGSQNIPFTIDGIRYTSIGDASKKLGIAHKTVHNRLNSKNPKFSNYLYEDETKRPIR
jgi:group I intron endonuclease